MTLYENYKSKLIFHFLFHLLSTSTLGERIQVYLFPVWIFYIYLYKIHCCYVPLIYYMASIYRHLLLCLRTKSSATDRKKHTKLPFLFQRRNKIKRKKYKRYDRRISAKFNIHCETNWMFLAAITDKICLLMALNRWNDCYVWHGNCFTYSGFLSHSAQEHTTFSAPDCQTNIFS